jgi:TetR/AcrR family fatty acid metabolism transcriptional regulator
MTRPNNSTRIKDQRRIQIIEATVAALAEVGYSATSFAEIGRRVGVSKSVVSYHFRHKELLIDAVVNTIYDKGFEVVRPRIDEQVTAKAQIEAFIRHSIKFYRDFASYVVALGRLRLHLTNAGKPNVVAAQRLHRELTDVAALFRNGQARGEFRGFDPAVMARTLRQALDGVLIEMTHHPDANLAHYADELVTLFTYATQRQEMTS